MTVGFSTSSPWAGVAIISTAGEVLWSKSVLAPGKASEACLELLENGLAESGTFLADADVFAADAGPGSFTGVRVGIVIAKTLAWQQAALCKSADAFDLVSTDKVVALPSRKGEFFVRVPW